MQGDWAEDGMTREGGVDNAHALVVDSFWQQQKRVYSKLPSNCTSKLYLKIVPQIVQKNPWKIEFSEGVFAQFEVQFEVRQIVPQIVPVFSMTEQAL